MLNVCSIYLKYHGSQTNKQNLIMTTCKKLLGTCIKSKKVAYIYILYVPNQLLKILQTNCFDTFGSSARQNMRCTATYSSHTNLQELDTNLIKAL